MATKRLPKTFRKLLNFVLEKILLTGKTKPLEANKINLIWQKFAYQMNSSGFGPQKTAEQWRKIISEWKVNVRRKSRANAVNRKGTGGGPNVSTPLTDLEERLLSIISKIHLGDTELKDTFTLAAMPEQLDEPLQYLTEFEDVIVVDSFSKEIKNTEENLLGNYELETVIIAEKSEQQAGPSKQIRKDNETEGFTPKERNSSAVDHTYIASQQGQRGNRYTSSLLQSACEAYKEGTQLGIELKKCKQENLLQLASNIEKMASAITENTTAVQARTNIEKAKLKLEYFKVFGNFENFEQLFNKE